MASETQGCRCGHLTAAEACKDFAAMIDEKRAAGTAVRLSNTQAGNVQAALEDAADAHRLACHCAPVPAAPAPEAARETDEQGVSSLEANKRGGEWFSAKYVERLRAALASSEAARREDLEDLEKALQRAEAAEAARATAERERDEAVKEAKRRDEKWMAGIREECAPTEITFDPLAPDVRRHVHTLGSFIRELRARAARAPEPQP